MEYVIRAATAPAQIFLSPISRVLEYAFPSTMTSTAPPPVQNLPSSASIRSVASNTSLNQYPRADEGEEVTLDVLPHSTHVLEARRYRKQEFAVELLTILQELNVKHWVSPAIQPEHVKIEKVSGSLTNAVFFVSAPDAPVSSSPRVVLLRIYGPSSSHLISRPDELAILYVLGTVYRIAPRVFGTFGNGRIEEYFPSDALTPVELRSPEISRWIGRRMSELHSVDIDDVMKMVGDEFKNAEGRVAVRRNMKKWLPLARDVIRSMELTEGSLPEEHSWRGFTREFDIDKFINEWETYWNWLKEFESKNGQSERVFAHNDTQYGNLLRLRHKQPGKPNHHQIIVVDFEYAAANAAAFDIANHFHEWCADYHDTENAHILRPSKYPTREERNNFYNAYLSPLPTVPSSTSLLLSTSAPNQPLSNLSGNNFVSAKDNPIVSRELERLEQQVMAWSPSSHAMWCIWGIVQACDDILAGEISDFDYIGYSRCRVGLFREGLKERGII